MKERGEKLFLVRYFIKDMNRMCEFGLEFGHSEMMGKGISGGNNNLSKGMGEKEEVFGLDWTVLL